MTMLPPSFSWADVDFQALTLAVRLKLLAKHLVIMRGSPRVETRDQYDSAPVGSAVIIIGINFSHLNQNKTLVIQHYCVNQLYLNIPL